MIKLSVEMCNEIMLFDITQINQSCQSPFTLDLFRKQSDFESVFIWLRFHPETNE